MAVKFNFVKKIIREDDINLNILLLTTIFGDKFPGSYNENEVYQKGDVIIALDDDGSYDLLASIRDNVTGPFDRSDWVRVSFTGLLKDSSLLSQSTIKLQSIQEGMADDTANLVFNLAGLLDRDIEFNQMFRENFKNLDNINLIKGEHVMGCIQSVNNGLEFQLFEAKEVKILPEKYKFKHHIEIKGLVGVECQLTFNGLDDYPFWFDANEAMVDGSFFYIPEFEKQEGIPYAINIRIKCNCESNSSIKISDFLVAFI